MFVEDDTGGRLASGRLSEGIEGVTRFHELVAGHVDDLADVVVATETDPGDAKVLADLAHTDAHNRRPVAGDSELAEAVKVLARTHQSMIWTRQRQTNQLRALDDLGGSDALAVLAIAPTPTAGQQLSRPKIAAALRRGDGNAASRNGPLRSKPGCAQHSSPLRSWSRSDRRHRGLTSRRHRRTAEPDRPARDPTGPPF